MRERGSNRICLRGCEIERGSAFLLEHYLNRHSDERLILDNQYVAYSPAPYGSE